jgi:spore germination protein PA
MPAIVGAINVNSVSGVFNIGDVGTIAPSSFNQTFAGGGSFNSGESLNINNSPSVINIYGADAFEQTVIAPESDVQESGG